jgi:hypothetical protein
VHEVLPVGQREVAADRARRGLAPVGRADQRANDVDRAVALEDQRHEPAAGHEVLERRVERLRDVLGVVLVGQVGVHLAQHHLRDGKALALEAAEDLPDHAATYRVRLDQDEGALDGAVGGHGLSSWCGRGTVALSLSLA